MNEPLNTPPYSEHSEQAVLGALLNNNDLFDDVAEIIVSEDFYNRHNRVVFNAISEELKQGHAVDVTTIANKPDIDLSYCVNLARNCPASINASRYAVIVKNKALCRQLIGACNEIQEQAFAHVENVDQLLGNAERKLSAVSERLLVSNQDNSAKTILKRTVQHLEYMATNDKSIIGIETGHKDLDTGINGYKKGTFIIIAARPSMGKTTFAMQSAVHEALAGGNPLVFSLETPAEQLMLKAISSIGAIDSSLLQRAKLDDTGWAKVGTATKLLANTNLELVDEPTITTDQIRIETRRYQKKYGKPTFIMIDYIQLIRGVKPENRTQEISQISRDLKALSREFNCPVVGLSQLNRDLEKRANKRPVNSDLRESGQLEQDADEIILIYRDEVYDENSPDKGKAEIIIGKTKTNMISTFVTNFEGNFARFSSTDDQRILSKESKPKPYASKFEC
jgi:replicative DNA helicase